MKNLFEPPLITWRHVKTGGLYRILGHAVNESTSEGVVIYCSEAGVYWVRPTAEFYDGRFEIVEGEA